MVSTDISALFERQARARQSMYGNQSQLRMDYMRDALMCGLSAQSIWDSPTTTRVLTFREELQKEIDEWLK